VPEHVDLELPAVASPMPEDASVTNAARFLGTPYSRTVDEEFDHLRGLLPGVRLEGLGLLTGSNRSRVRRVRADSRSLIVKEFITAGEGWVRESAALAVIPDLVRVPRLIAADGIPPIVVMTDAGPGASVAGALLGTDPAAAADAVVAWAATIGELHRATAGTREAFRAALDARAGGLPVAESTMPALLDEAADVIARSAADLGVEVPACALDELRTLDDRLGVAALTPSDACPDNNVFTDDGPGRVPPRGRGSSDRLGIPVGVLVAAARPAGRPTEC
jgi:hypothetical protein